MNDGTYYIYNYNKIKHIVSKMKPKILEYTSIEKNSNTNYYDQVLINVKYNKLQNYKRCVIEFLELELTNKNTHTLKELLREIDECINILEPVKQLNQSLIKDIALLDIDLDLELEDDEN